MSAGTPTGDDFSEIERGTEPTAINPVEELNLRPQTELRQQLAALESE